MKYTRIFADEEGETHFKDVEIELESVDVAYSESPLYLSPYIHSTQYAFFVFPSGMHGDWHQAPRKQILFLLSGEMELQVSDGESRRLHAGSIVLTEDKTGKGHMGKVLGSADVVGVVIQLPD